MKLFRAYDSKQNKWYGQDDPNCLLFKDFAIFGECTQMCTPDADHIQHLIITQYIYIDDSYKQKVYEGDIIEYTDTSYKNNRLIEQVKRHVIGSNEKAHRSITFIKGLIMMGKAFKVVGNIFENPEMVEVKK